MAVQHTLSIKDCRHLFGRNVPCTSNNITLKGHVTTNDKTLEVHVSTKDGKLDGRITTNNKMLKGKHTIWVLTSPCVLS
jgi:hypothetical protein